MSAGVSVRVRRSAAEPSADWSCQACGLLLCHHPRFPSARAQGILSESVRTRGPIKSLRHMWRPCPGSNAQSAARLLAGTRAEMFSWLLNRLWKLLEGNNDHPPEAWPQLVDSRKNPGLSLCLAAQVQVIH